MNLSQLYYYRELAREKSFKKAAEKLFISEPTLSVAVKNLERELGSDLVIRKRGNISLTEDGQEFYACLENSLTYIDEHINAIKTHAHERNSTLRIGIVFSLQQRIWLPLINDFWVSENRAPDNVIKQGTTQQLLRALKNDEVDVIIAGKMGEDDAVESHPMWTTPALAAINTKNPLSGRESVTFDDIRSYNLITYVSDGPLGPESKKLSEEFDLDLEFAYINEPSICSNVAVSPETIGIVCDSWLAYSTHGVNIVPISDSPVAFHRFWMTHRANPPKKQTLLNDFIEFAKDFDYASYL